MKSSPRRILGLDPGYGRFGWAIVIGARPPRLLASGCIETSAHLSLPKRLAEIASQLEKIISVHHPQEVALEKLFFTRNVSTAIDVAQARGVAMLVGERCGLTLREFTPTDVKLATTGDGRAEKPQITKMVALLLSLPHLPKTDDEIDAMAVSLCATASRLTA